MKESVDAAAYNYAIHKTDFRKDVLKEVDEDDYDFRLSDCQNDFKAGAEWAEHINSAEMVKQETKEKCQIAFRNFMLRATLANVSGESFDFEKEFAETMSEI